MFLTEEEKSLSKEYLEKGYIIRPIADKEALEWVRGQYDSLIRELLDVPDDISTEMLLNTTHDYVSVPDLNNFRLSVIQKINSIEQFREKYFQIARKYIEIIVGNELAMQLRVNLSIQLPQDDSSLLPVHSDTWSGDSSYEVVAWLPLVDCFGTKAMYILPPKENAELDKEFKEKASGSSEMLYQSIKNQVQWLEVKYGEVVIFDQSLPHGNRVNEEDETRWSMNCRFKEVFTPYGDKKIGEFFEPITLRAASKRGMSYKLPEINEKI
jgi:sporadic carbohydrate cluster 2OG-Fe(II) oxygenase